MRLVLQKIGRFIGPYEYNPRTIFIFIWALFLSRLTPLAFAEPEGSERIRVFFTVFVIAALPALAYSSTAWLFNRFRRWPAAHLGFYLLEVLLTVVVVGIVFAAFARSNWFNLPASFKGAGPSISLASVPVMFIFAVLANAVLSLGERQIRNRLRDADALAANLDEQSRLLILAESELKNQVSQFLHDRVQSRLLVASVKLQELAKSETKPDSEYLSGVIADLEAIRSQDLRLAIQSLSPNLDSMDLSDAIANLLAQDLGNVECEVDIAQNADLLNPDMKMAVFKIAEQAMLNSQMHGKASKIAVRLAENETGQWTLTISDDGRGSRAKKNKPGLGTAVIDSWVRVISGTKALEDSAAGYKLTIKFSA